MTIDLDRKCAGYGLTEPGNGQEQLMLDPLILLVPGLGNSGAGHWQTRWEEGLPQCRRVDLGLWEDPRRNTWVNKLGLAIERAGRPVVLVAHSLGCHAVAWWAEYERLARLPDSTLAPAWDHVVGALLVAPPDVEDVPRDRRLTRFAPVPPGELPFPAIVVASRNDPYATMAQSRSLARRWGADFADAGAVGHINAQSGLGRWKFGMELVSRFMPRAAPLEGWRADRPFILGGGDQPEAARLDNGRHLR